MGLYQQLSGGQLGNMLNEAHRDLGARLAAGRSVCSIFRHFPAVWGAFPRVGCKIRAEHLLCQTVDEFVRAAETLASGFVMDARTEVADVIREPQYVRKLSGWPYLADVTCPARRRDAQGKPGPIPILPAGRARVAVDAGGQAGAFEYQLSYGWPTLFIAIEDSATGGVRLWLSYDYRVTTVA